MVNFLVCSRKVAKGRYRHLLTLCAEQYQTQLIVQKFISFLEFFFPNLKY